MNNYTKLRSLLKQEYPEYSIKVRRVKLSHYGTWQVIDSKKKEFLIKIDKDSSVDNQCDALIHEWAHCLCYGPTKTPEGENQHKAVWGITYAKLYRLYEDRILKDDSEE